MEDAPIPIAELDHGPSKFETFLENHQKKLVILAILIFLGVLAYVFMTGYKKKQAEEAGAAFMVATDEDGYTNVISEHSSSQAAGSAALAIAKLRTTDDDKIKAIDHYVSTYPKHPGIPSALLDLALIQINANKLNDAKTTLEKLIANENSAFLEPRAKIAQADIAFIENDIKKSERIYKEVESGKSHFSAIAVERLLYLKAVEPAVVKAPNNPLPPLSEAGINLPNLPPAGSNALPPFPSLPNGVKPNPLNPNVAPKDIITPPESTPALTPKTTVIPSGPNGNPAAVTPATKPSKPTSNKKTTTE